MKKNVTAFAVLVTTLMATAQVANAQTTQPFVFNMFDEDYYGVNNPDLYKVIQPSQIIGSTTESWTCDNADQSDCSINAPYALQRAFDGDVNTFYNGPHSSYGDGLWLGVQFANYYNTRQRISAIKFRPRQGFENRMRGGYFQASIDPNFTQTYTIYTIPQNVNLQYKDYYIICSGAPGIFANYIRYVGPDGSYANIAELKFYNRSGDDKFTMSTSTPDVTNTDLYYQHQGQIVSATTENWDCSSNDQSDCSENARYALKSAFDGNINTCYTGPNYYNGNGLWLGRSVADEGGNPGRISVIKFRPRQGFDNMRGGYFEVSNNPDFADARTVYKIPTNANLSFQDYYLECNNANGVEAKYIRYVGPDGSYGNVSELAFYRKNNVEDLNGIFFVSQATGFANAGSSAATNSTVIGSPGSWDGVSTINKVFDGYANTYFDAPVGDNQWVGLDLNQTKQVIAIRFSPRLDYAHRMIGGKFQVSDNPNFNNAKTIYTIPSGLDFSGGNILIESKNSANGGINARYVRYVSPNGGFGNIAEMKVIFRNPVQQINTKVSLVADAEPSIYPNPVTNLLQIKYAEKINSVNIMSVDGRSITPNRVGESSIDCSSLASGTYILIINNEHQIKFIKS